MNLSCVFGSVLESMLLAAPSKNLFQQTAKSKFNLQIDFCEIERVGTSPCNRARSERFRQSGLTQDSIGGVSARNADRHGKISFGNRAVPDFVTAAPLPDQRAAGGAQQIPQRAIELRRHSACGRFGFAQRGNLQEQRFRSNIGMIVRQ